jgi:RNA polymerase sigma-70 factor (ECF subfamily)
VSIWPEAYAEHAAGLRRFLGQRLRSADLAEDLTQETFVRAMDAEAAIRDPEKIRPYLYQVAHRLLLNHVRRPDRVRNESDLGESVDVASLAPESTDRSDDPVHEREVRDAVNSALEGIPEDQARAFTWAVLEQRSYSEIEEHTGWSRSKVKISVFRARKRVMEELEALGLGPGGDRKEGSE